MLGQHHRRWSKVHWNNIGLMSRVCLALHAHCDNIASERTSKSGLWPTLIELLQECTVGLLQASLHTLDHWTVWSILFISPSSGGSPRPVKPDVHSSGLKPHSFIMLIEMSSEKSSFTLLIEIENIFFETVLVDVVLCVKIMCIEVRAAYYAGIHCSLIYISVKSGDCDVGRIMKFICR